MRSRIAKNQAKALSQVALVALVSAMAAGCSAEATRFNQAVYTGSTPNQKAIIGGGRNAALNQPMPAPIKAVDVTGSVPVATAASVQVPKAVLSQPLPPVARKTTATATSRLSDTIQKHSQVVAAKPILPPVANRPETIKLAQATMPTLASSVAKAPTAGWSPIGGTVISVGQGETLYSISRRYGVPVEALMSANKMKSAADLQAGNQLIIPTYIYSRKAPVSAPDYIANKRLAAQAGRLPTPPVKPSYLAAEHRAKKLSKMQAYVAKAPIPPRAVGQAPTPVRLQPRPVVASRTKTGTYMIEPGDSLMGIARRHNITTAQLINANKLENPNDIKIGQKLTIPSALPRPVQVAAKKPRPADNVVTGSIPSQQPKAQVYRPMPPMMAVFPRPRPPYNPAQKATAQKPAVAPQKTAALVNFPMPRPRPAIKRPVKYASVKPTVTPVSQANQAKPYVAPEVVKKPVQVAAKPTVVKQTVPGSVGKFRWPVHGRIISNFGAKLNGKRNEGINLSVPAGTSVKAAEDGVVAYSGNEVEGYGNLVLIKHTNGWISAYAHNDELLVKRGDTVSRGQIVARAGRTGSVNQPQLHFELRRGSTPIDPLKYLVKL